jgi:hypothetical protein
MELPGRGRGGKASISRSMSIVGLSEARVNIDIAPLAVLTGMVTPERMPKSAACA